MATNEIQTHSDHPVVVPHSRDAHCEDAESLDDDDNCRTCGASSGDECPSCGGCRYHEPGCMESTAGVKVIDGGDEAGTPGPRTARSMESWLEDAIRAYCEEDGIGNGAVITFEDAGVLTRDRGLVVKFGAVKFQVSIVQDRR